MIEYSGPVYSVARGNLNSALFATQLRKDNPNITTPQLKLEIIEADIKVDSDRLNLDDLSNTNVSLGLDNQGTITEVVFHRIFTEDGVSHDVMLLDRMDVVNWIILPVDLATGEILPIETIKSVDDAGELTAFDIDPAIEQTPENVPNRGFKLASEEADTVFSVFDSDDRDNSVADVDAFADALAAASAGGLIRVNQPDVAGDIGDVSIDVESLTIEGDAVFSGTLTAAVGIEDIQLLGTNTADLTGNGENNFLLGSDGDNVLIGLDGDDDLAGEDGADSLVGGQGNDTLRGGLGEDTHEGGIGDDEYIVRDLTDVVIEAPGEGTDLLKARVDFVLPDNVENIIANAGGLIGLSLGGNSEDNLIRGNAADDTLSGNDGNDVLRGLGGSNELFGGGDNDRLFATAGNNTMDGGTGNDKFFVRDADTVIIEAAGEGRDVVLATVDFELTAGAHVETLATVSSAGLALFGNELDQKVRGGAGNDVIGGGDGGNDNLVGKGGADTFVFEGDWGNDRVLDFEDGIDRISMVGTGVESFDDFDLVRGIGSGDNAKTKIFFNDNTIILNDVAVDLVTAEDFIFDVFNVT